jgi:hypothetical protein
MDSKNISEVLKGEKKEDLHLLNEENAVRIVFNETHETNVSMDWLSGDDRATDSALAMQTFGSKHKTQGHLQSYYRRGFPHCRR